MGRGGGGSYPPSAFLSAVPVINPLKSPKLRLPVFSDNYPAVLLQIPSMYISRYCNTFAAIISLMNGFELEK